MKSILSQVTSPTALNSGVITVGTYLLIGLVIALLARPVARGVLWLGRLGPSYRRPTDERLRTLEGLIASLISILAVVASLSLFVKPETLIWIVGLFSAAFGFGARGLVADLLAGASFIFHNTFAISEKVEFYLSVNQVEGTVEEANVRNTLDRASYTEVTILANSSFGQAATLRLRLIALVYHRLNAAGITLREY